MRGTILSAQARARRWGARLVLSLSLLLSLWALAGAPNAAAEGTVNLVAKGGDRALTEWRTSQYGNALRRRTFLKVYAVAGEKINMGSSAVGVGSGDIVVWNPGLINTYAASQSLTLPAISFSCKASQVGLGKLTTRAQELAGPTKPDGSNPSGYAPCIYTAPSTGIYWVAFYGPSGGSSDVSGSAGTIDAPLITTAQNSGVSMFDITVRNGANTTPYPGRVFTDYLVQQTGGNGATNRINSILYALTRDGFQYEVDMRGLDPNAFVLYGNTVGFLNPDGVTPLYHDLYDGANDTLTAPKGGVTLAPPTGFLFFNRPDASLPASVAPAPLLPSVSSITFQGTAGPNLYGDNVPSSFVTTGGNFVYNGNVGGVSEVIIIPNPGSCATATYDPTASTNRVLRAALASGVQNLPWDGKNNSGASMALSYPGYSSSLGYCYKATLHAGEYHFPLLDAENSMLGGPTITLLNPPGGKCPLTNCSTAFFDDRGYTTTSNITIGTVGVVLTGNNPPSPPFSLTGFDTATAARAYGNDGSTGFGDKKGMDLWTYYPSPDVVGRLYIVPQGTSDLAVNKIHTGDFTANAPNNYTIAVRNVGTGSIAGTITVNDAVPASMPVQSVSAASPWSCSFAGQTLTCTATPTGGLAAGASLPDITLTVKPNYPTDLASANVNNTATVANSNDTNPANNSSSSPTTISSADLAVTKTASPTNPVEGATVAYTIRVTNNGPSTADNVTVTDVIPAALTYVSSSASLGSYSSGSGIWTVGTLLNGASATLILNATVNVGQSGQTIGNSATVSGGPYDYASTNNTANASLTIPPTVLTGVITDQNTGLPISGATVNVTDSAGHTFTVITGADGKYTITGSPSAPLAAGPAAVSASAAGYVAATASPTVAAGATTTQNLALTPLSLSGVVTDLGTGVPIVGATVTLTQGTNTCTTTTGPGGAYSFVYPTCPYVIGGATPTVSASATGYQTASAPTILSTGPTTQDLKLGTADLLITKTDSQTAVQPGQALTYLITVKNNGSIDAAGVALVDKIPKAFLTYNSSSGTNWSCTYDSSSDPTYGILTCTFSGSLATNTPTTLTVAATVSNSLPDGTTSISNYAKVTTTGPEKDTTNNEVSDVDTVTAHPDLTLTDRAAAAHSPVQTGDTIYYTYSGTNLGAATATGVKVVATLDSHVTYVTGSVTLKIDGVSYTPTVVVSGQTVTFTFPAGATIPPGKAWELKYNATAGSSLGTTIVNSATISEAQTDTNPANNTDAYALPAAAGVDLYLAKAATASTSPAAPGSTILYTLNYGNKGSTNATNVVITDPLPANTTFVSATGGGLYTAPNVAWNVGSLAAGASGAVQFTVQIGKLPAGDTAINNGPASIAATGSDELPADNTASASTPVTAQPDLVISKDDGVTQVLAGGAVAYTIKYRNTGNQAATGVKIVDTLLNGVTFVSDDAGGVYTPPTDTTPGTITWNIGALTDFTEHTISLSLKVNADAIPSSVAADRVTITDNGTNGTDPNPADNTATDSDLVVAPYIVLEKHAASPARTGDELTYTVDWRNTGAAAANGVTIVDALPANTEFVSADSGGVYNSGTGKVTWNLGKKDPDAFGTVSFKVTVNAGAGGALQTTPTLSTETGSGSVTVTSSATTPPMGSKPWCELDKCAAFKDIYQGTNGTPPAGWNDNPRMTAFDDAGWLQPAAASTDELAYWTSASTLSAEWVAPNTAGHTEGNFTFFRQAFCLPLNATGLSANLQLAGDDVSDIYLNGVGLGQKVGAGGAASFAAGSGIQSGVNILAVQLLNNRHGGHPISGCPGCDHIGLLFNLGAAYTGLRPFASAPAMVMAGEKVTFAADELALGGRKPYQYTISYDDGATWETYQETPTFTHPYPTPGTYTAIVKARAGYGCTGTDTVEVTVLPATSTLLANPATVSYQDANGKTLSGQSGAGVDLLQPADLTIAKTVTTSGIPGQGITYQLVVTNVGPSAVTGAAVADTIPAAVTGVTWTCASASGTCAHAGGSGNALSETVNLPQGATATYTIQGTISPAASGTLDNTATVAPPAGAFDQTPNNNTSTVSTALKPTVDLRVTKTGSPNPAVPGQAYTYSIVVTNAGPTAVTGATVADTIPAALTSMTWTCVSSGGTCGNASGSSSMLNETVNLPKDATATYTIRGTLDPAATGTLANTATVTAPATVFELTSGDNTSTVSTTLAPTVDLAITKTSSPNPAVPGAQLTYSIVVSNAGPSDAAAATVADAFPDLVGSVTWTCTATAGSACTPNGTGSINDTIRLKSGGSATYTATGTLDAWATDTLINTASVSPAAGVTDSDTANNNATNANTPAARARILAYKFYDLNADGTWDPTEPGLGGWTMELFSGSDCGGTAAQTAVTGADGSVRFAPLAAGGSYSVRETLQAGWLTSTATCRNITVALGGTATVPFGNYQAEWGALPATYGTAKTILYPLDQTPALPRAVNGMESVQEAVWLGAAVSAATAARTDSADPAADGITARPSWNASTGKLQMQVQVGSSGTPTGLTLGVWIDWNKDGVFNAAAFSSGGEMYLLAVGTGLNTLALTAPAGFAGDSALEFRLRLYAGDPGTPSPAGAVSDGEVEDYVYGLSPLAVDVAFFTAAATPAGVTLAWETVSETDNAGFNVYRVDGAQSETGPSSGTVVAGLPTEPPAAEAWTRLNAALIPAAAPGSSEGHAYAWTDATAQPNTVYVYRLESVALDGTAEVKDVTGITYRPAQRRWLPFAR